MQTKLLINGALVEGLGPELPIVDPATGQQVATVNAASDAQILAAVSAANTAFDGHWGKASPAERAERLLCIADKLEEHSEELARLESLDCGKPWPSARDDEMPLSVDTFRFMAGAARTQMGSAAGEYVAGFTSMIRKDPIGPVASIAPWNYPLMMAAWKLAAPLAAGCSVVLKPSELTPLSTLRAAALMAEILPPGVVNVIAGDGPGVGDKLINNPGIEGISVTGSPATGMAAMRAAAAQIRHVHLELGGKAPVIVFDDADIDSLVETIRGGSFFNAGQDCAQPCRILVQDGIYDRVVAQLASQCATIQCGAPDEEGVEMGPIISAKQRERVAGFVERARQDAEVVCGGHSLDREGFFYAPTVIANVDNRAEIACNEVFGPVITVSRFTDADDVLGTVNASRYGLASSVWTGNVGLAMKMTSQMRYGFTWVNTHGVGTPEMPWAAMKGSGTGCVMSVYALDAYCAVRHVMVAH